MGSSLLPIRLGHHAVPKNILNNKHPWPLDLKDDGIGSFLHKVKKLVA
jgi:hypothetical protein